MFFFDYLKFSVSDPYSLNPDPAKNLNPDLSYFLTLSEKKFNYFLIIRFSHQKKSIERKNVVKVTKKQCCGSGSVLDPYSGASWIRIRIRNTDSHKQI